MKASFLLFVVCLGALAVCNAGDLRKQFYKKSCPLAEDIVRNITQQRVSANSGLPAKLLRMHFHDCFVRGCDASVLLNSTANNTAEKDATPNLSLAGFDVIDEIKAQLEQTCPGVVSCADIVALSTRDAVSFQFNRSMWEVLTGRRDGNVSVAWEALAKIPAPTSNFTTLKRNFANKGLNVHDLVVLSGAHTIGVAHCNDFSNRLYNFTGKGDADPSLNSTYSAFLRTKCQSLSDTTTTVEMDPQSSLSFDSNYYVILKQNQGLFQSDAALLTNKGAAKTVDELTNMTDFFTEFSQSMKRMGAIGVLTGSSGEIRKKCSVVSSS
ncbi:peroxidase 3-like isoform X2 [Magnolia sinica]|nr:peroxidase 3-like isoform X2 [Magnolia sinica]